MDATLILKKRLGRLSLTLLVLVIRNREGSNEQHCFGRGRQNHGGLSWAAGSWPLANHHPGRGANAPLPVRDDRMAPASQSSPPGLPLPCQKPRLSTSDSLDTIPSGLLSCQESRGAPYLARFSRDAPNFLHVARDKAACAPFFRGKAHSLRGTH
jgi:hypothetical protein